MKRKPLPLLPDHEARKCGCLYCACAWAQRQPKQNESHTPAPSAGK